MTRILDALLTSSVGAAVLGESDAKRRGKREALADELARHNATAERERKPLAERRAAAERELATAKKALATAQQGLQKAHSELVGFDSVAVREREKIERDLRASAGPLLDEFLGRVHAELERLRNWRRLETRGRTEVTGYSISAGPIRKVVAEDNYDLLRARLDALVAAEREAEHLARTRVDFGEELTRLWDNLPSETLK